MLSHVNRVRLFATLWTIAVRAPLSMGFSRKDCCSGLPFPPPRDLPNPRIKPESPAARILQENSLLLSHQGSPKTIYLLSILFVSIHLRIETLITRLRKSHLILFLYFLSLFTSYHFLWNYCISSSWGASGLNVSFFSSSIYFKVYFLLFFLKAFISNYFLGL